MQCALLPRARAAVRVWSASVSASVSRLAMCSSCPPVPRQFLAAKSKSSPSQIESGRAIPRGPSLPIGLLPPPAPISFPAHHQGEPNSPQAFPFPSIKGPGLGRFSQPGLDPFSQTQFPRCLLCLPGLSGSSHGLLLLLLPAHLAATNRLPSRPRPRLSPPPPPLLLLPPPRLALTDPVPLPGPVSCVLCCPDLPCPIRPIYSTRRVRITELVTAFGC